MTSMWIAAGMYLVGSGLAFAIGRALGMRKVTFEVDDLRRRLDLSARLCAGCGDPPPSSAHDHGWRFQTCSDGKPRWKCGACRFDDAPTGER